jgi:AcrR family transcriptional regulator
MECKRCAAETTFSFFGDLSLQLAGEERTVVPLARERVSQKRYGDNSGLVAKITARKTGYKKSEVSRKQVLDAAIVVLAKQGVAATSVQDIADAAGLSKGAIHYHFESKEELLERVLDRCCEVVEARVRAVFAEPGLPLERIQRALTEMWRVRRDGVREMRVITELHQLARQNRRIKKACGEALQRARRQIIDTGLEELVGMGLKPRVAIEVIPRLLLATLDGLALHQEVDPVSKEQEHEVLQAIEATAVGLFEI